MNQLQAIRPERRGAAQEVAVEPAGREQFRDA
jgi:hypothetical protein